MAIANETVNGRSGRVLDWPASIAAVGMAPTAYPVGVERGFLLGAESVERSLTTLRFFWRSTQGPEPDGIGYKGFYYHFLDIQTGARVGWQWAQNGGATATHDWRPEEGFLPYRWQGAS